MEIEIRGDLKVSKETFKLGRYRMRLTFDHYTFDNSLYVGIMVNSTGEYWDDLTTCCGSQYRPLNKRCALVQTGMVNGTNYIEWLESTGIAKRTGRGATSGWNTYAEMEFDIPETF